MSVYVGITSERTGSNKDRFLGQQHSEYIRVGLYVSQVSLVQPNYIRALKTSETGRLFDNHIEDDFHHHEDNTRDFKGSER
jgi:hypothetical protein